MISSNAINKNFKVFFIGIGGVSTSALAEFLFNKGFSVYGSDRELNYYCKKLIDLGVTVYIGHDENNVKGMNIVVVNSAIDDNNPEIVYCKNNKIPIIKRAELLKLISEEYKNKIGVSGSHGKTTVTSLIAHIFKRAGERFTAFIGGSDLELDNYANFGYDVLISEVCEFRKNIEYFNADYAVTLNIDNDHLDSYSSFSELTETFYDYLSRSNIPVINGDDKLLNCYKGEKVTFGLSNKNDYYAQGIVYGKKTKFSVFYKCKKLMTVKSRLQGRHNVYNVLCAVTVAKLFSIPNSIIKRAVEEYRGVKRRNEYLGEIKNGVKCYSDYAHHPKEIECLIDSVVDQSKSGKTFYVFQPHTYSRTRILFKDFCRVLSKIDNLIIYKTYSAREKFDRLGSAKRLSDSVLNAVYSENFEEIISILKKTTKKDDQIYFVGAGDLDQLIREYLKTSR